MLLFHLNILCSIRLRQKLRCQIPVNSKILVGKKKSKQKKHALLSPELVNILVQYERERLCTAVNDVSFASVAQEEFFL